MFVEVIIPLALPKNYTWSVPESLQSAIQPGVRVDVGFGKNKRYAGIVKKILPQAPDSFQPKAIIQVLDEEPVLHPIQLHFWDWIASYYLCTEGDVMQAAIPANLKLSSESILIWNEDRSLDFSDLNDREFLVAEALELKKELRVPEVQQILDSRHVYPVIKQLIDKEVCYVWEELKEKYREKKETYIQLSANYKNEQQLEQLLNEWKKGPKQMELLLAFLHLQRTAPEITQKDLLEKAGATHAQLKGLIQKGVLETIQRRVDRIGILPQAFHLDFTLSEAQAVALASIRGIFTQHLVCLLHGVTASGKTELYVHLIAEQIQAGKQVLYMLPEIALTAQIIRRLQQYLG
ncbi:MAG TPA: DEAD/DEAH box helicase, partial [Sediminibacterium sp.]|nr:DEAD/DEAH box helicase [Sediminibacterium sp.]